MKFGGYDRPTYCLPWIWPLNFATDSPTRGSGSIKSQTTLEVRLCAVGGGSRSTSKGMIGLYRVGEEYM